MNRLLVIHSRQRSGDGDRAVGKIGIETPWPAIRTRGDRFQFLAASIPPMLLGIFGQSASDFPLHHHRCIVPWTGIMAIRLQPLMSGFVVGSGIPTVIGNVDTTAESRVFVDNDDFLVMRRTNGVVSVEFKMQPGMKEPADQSPQTIEPKKGFQRSGIPTQHIDSQVGIVLEQPVEIGADLKRPLRCLGCVMHFHPFIKIPAQQNDPLPRLRERLAYRTKIIFTVDKNRSAIRICHAPAIFSRFEYIRHR